MQATSEDNPHQAPEASCSDTLNTNDQTLKKTLDEDVDSEYLSELPPFLQEKMSVGKKLYSGCVRMQHQTVTLYLLDADLWHMFRNEGTEMIITKKGRRVFPVPSYALSGLDPEKLYNVTLAVNSADHTIHKFCNGEWIPSKEGSHLYPTPVPGRSTYMHPFSPNTGFHWMREPIIFSGMKISNNLDAMGTIVLQSMRKYMMSVIISELNGSMTLKISQPETLFVAVTQYQNDKITQMKIEHNPFANGFRFPAIKSKDKSKRQMLLDADSEDENKADEVTSNSSSPLDSPQPFYLSSRENSESVNYNTNKLVAYLNEKREALKHLLPVYIDRLKVEELKQNQSTDPKTGSWTSLNMPVRGASYPVYNNTSALPGISPKRGFMLGEANPLAQVRKLGDINRCSQMEAPLSLVKKKKREEHMVPEECCNESPCKSLPDFSNPTRSNLHVTNKNNVSNDTLCHLQTPFVDDHNGGHINANEVDTKVRHDKTDSSLKCRLSYRGNEQMLSKKSEVSEDPSRDLHTRKTVDLHGDSIAHSMCCLPPTSSMSVWRTANSDEDNDRATDLRLSENYSSANLRNERWLLTSVKPEITLKNRDLWAATHEVVISSEGRPMFPSVSLSVNSLDPDRQYHVGLKLIPNTPWFYDYTDHEWTQSCEATGDYKVTFYPHPDNPKSGCQWGADIIFDRLRLSTLKQGKNTVKLQHRRQYLPIVTIDTENQLWEYPLNDAIFITVKIDRSPYVLSGPGVCYPTSTPEFDRIINESLTRSAHRKQTNPKRRSSETASDKLWTLSSLPAQSYPLDLKTTSSSRASPAVTYQLPPAAWTFSSPSSVSSAVSTSPASETVTPAKHDRYPDTNQSDSLLIRDYSYH